MANETNDTHEPVMIDMTRLTTLRKYAAAHGVRYGTLRKMHHAGTLTGTVYLIADKLYVYHDATIDVPDTVTRTKRTDNRQRFVVFMTNDERAQIAAIVGTAQIVDVRERAKQRRARRKSERDASNDNVDGDGNALPEPGTQTAFGVDGELIAELIAERDANEHDMQTRDDNGLTVDGITA